MFGGATFLVAGHRANAVRRALIENFKLPAGAFVVVGYGKTRPKNIADPFAGENRRVRIVAAERK